MSVALKSGAAASYTWTSGICRFSSRTPLDTTTLNAALTQESAGRATWTTSEELRSIAAVLHESAHLIQDVTTGVGHHDYCVTERARSQGLYVGRLRTIDPSLNQASPIDMFSVWADVFESQMYLCQQVEVQCRRRKVREEAIAGLGAASIPFGPALGAESLDLEALLEGAAMAVTLSTLLNLDASPAQQAMMGTESHLLRPDMMGVVYDASFQGCLAMTRELCRSLGDDPDCEIGPGETLAPAVARVMLRLLADLAMSVAPIRGEEQELRPENDPGLRFYRLARALWHALSNRAYQSAIRDAFMRREYAVIEEILIGPSAADPDGLSYPTTREVYAMWAEELRRCAASDAMIENDPLTEVRIQACEERIADPGCFWELRVGDYLARKLPIVFYTHDGKLGIVGIDDTKFRSRMLVGAARKASYAGVYEHLLTGSRFECLLARGLCGSASALCKVGIADIGELPADGCEVRRFLVSHGFGERSRASY